MISPLAKSIALASLIISPSTTSLAFTTLPSTSPQYASARLACSTRTVLLASAADDNNSQQQQQQQPRPSLTAASSSQEEQFSDIDLPSHNQDASSSSSSSAASSSIESSLTTTITTNKNNAEPRSTEFHNLEPLLPSSTRRSRLEIEHRTQSTYVPSGTNPYWQLQDEILQLEKDLQSAIDVGVSDAAIHAIQGMLRRAQSKDPEHVYKITLGAAQSADMLGRLEASAKYREESSRARKMLPQFNLEGLWVGKYGSHGFEMINVTYSGDRLIAYKVTGDKNIPRGEITFTADLSPFSDELPGQPPKLDPILLSESSAKKWGTTRLPRFRGQGHAAEPGFVNHQFMEGQLVVIGGGDYFSFAWVPLEHQIFFGRPSPELTLKMLREGGGTSLTAGVGLDVPDCNAGVKEQREYVSRCLEVTCDAMWEDSTEGKIDPMSCIWHGDDDEYCFFE